MRRMSCVALAFCGLAGALAGCQHPSVSAVSLNAHHCDHHFAFLYDPCKEPEGIPFYLPKPLLIISKNFRNIEEAKVGLTDTAPIPNFFDDQAKYADLNARTNFAGLDGKGATGTPATTSGDQKFPDKDATNLASKSGQHIFSGNGAPVTPGTVPPDGLKPEAFFTYQIVFVPDITQKYGLRVKGGAGEIRAAMNLVNGWQFTGLGPYYMKDSSTAQNTLAGGITANLAASGVADVVTAVAGLRGGAGGTSKLQSGPAPNSKPKEMDYEQVQALVDAMKSLKPCFVSIPGYAEISVYEPYISPEGTMEWKQIAEKTFARDVLGTTLDHADVMNLLGNAPAFRDIPPTSKPPTEPTPLPAPATTPSPFAPGAGEGPPARPVAPAIGPTSSLPPLLGQPRASSELNKRGSLVTRPTATAKSDGALLRTQAPTAPVPATASAPTAPPITGATVLKPGDVLTETTEAPVTASEVSLHRELLRGVLAQGIAGTAPPVTPAPAVATPTGPVGANQVNLHQYFGHAKVAGPAVDHAGKKFTLFHRKEKSRPTVKTINVGGLALSPTAADIAASPAVPQPTPTDVKNAGSGTPVR